MKNVLVIGGGISGVETAYRLNKMGHRVTIIEKSDKIGGKMNNWYCLFPDFKKTDEVLNYLNKLISQSQIELRLNSTVEKVERQGKHWFVYTQNVRYTFDAVVIATGFEIFDASKKEELGYKIYDNVYTQADIEQKFKDNNLKNSYGEDPKRIAIVHCVGSRDEKCHNNYCSKVCCVTGVKQAIELSEKLPNTQIFCFYMDLRMYDKHFEELYRKAQQHYNIQFIRGRVSEVSQSIDGKLNIKTEDTLSGRPMKMKLDMLVLLAGMQNRSQNKKLEEIFGVQTNESGFLKSKDFHLKNSVLNYDGVFGTGCAVAPMSIKETLENARSTAFEVNDYLNFLENYD